MTVHAGAGVVLNTANLEALQRAGVPVAVLARHILHRCGIDSASRIQHMGNITCSVTVAVTIGAGSQRLMTLM